MSATVPQAVRRFENEPGGAMARTFSLAIALALGLLVVYVRGVFGRDQGRRTRASARPKS